MWLQNTCFIYLFDFGFVWRRGGRPGGRGARNVKMLSMSLRRQRQWDTMHVFKRSFQSTRGVMTPQLYTLIRFSFFKFIDASYISWFPAFSCFSLSVSILMMNCARLQSHRSPAVRHASRDKEKHDSSQLIFSRKTTKITLPSRREIWHLIRYFFFFCTSTKA